MIHDDDVAFTREHAADPATGAPTLGAFKAVARVDRLDRHMVEVVFHRPAPCCPAMFRGTGMILPRDRRPSR